MVLILFSYEQGLDSLEILFYTFTPIRLKEIKMAYAHTNSKGNTYYLHSNGKMFYFAKEVKAEGALDAVPAGYNVAEMKTGLLVLKKNVVEAKPEETKASS
jgi:hypothetical protein